MIEAALLGCDKRTRQDLLFPVPVDVSVVDMEAAEEVRACKDRIGAEVCTAGIPPAELRNLAKPCSVERTLVIHLRFWPGAADLTP